MRRSCCSDHPGASRSAETKCSMRTASSIPARLGPQNFEGDLFELTQRPISCSRRSIVALAPARSALSRDVRALRRRYGKRSSAVAHRTTRQRLRGVSSSIVSSLPATLRDALSAESQGHRASNPLIAEPITWRLHREGRPGTQKMIRLCREAGLPERRSGARRLLRALLRDWLRRTARAFDLNERKCRRWRSSAVPRPDEYPQGRQTRLSKRAATRDLAAALDAGLIEASPDPLGRESYQTSEGPQEAQGPDLRVKQAARQWGQSGPRRRKNLSTEDQIGTPGRRDPQSRRSRSDRVGLGGGSRGARCDHARSAPETGVRA